MSIRKIKHLGDERIITEQSGSVRRIRTLCDAPIVSNNPTDTIRVKMAIPDGHDNNYGTSEVKYPAWKCAAGHLIPVGDEE